MAERVEWHEVRNGELFFVIGDWIKDGWEFSERSTWESRWYPAPATSEMTTRANSLGMNAQTKAA